MAGALENKLILVTGAAKRIGKAIAIGLAQAGADIIIHHGPSTEEALIVQGEILDLGRHAYIQSDLGDIDQLTGVTGQVEQFG